MGLPERDGLLVRTVEDGSAAARAGIAVGDLLVRAGDRVLTETDDLFEVLDAERTRLQAQDAFADVRTRTAVSAVALYRAMAGGWPSRLPEDRRVGQRD